MNEPKINMDAVHIGYVKYENRLGFKISKFPNQYAFGIHLDFKGVKKFSKPMFTIYFFNRVVFLGYILQEPKK